jgi:hypothetical protein
MHANACDDAASISRENLAPIEGEEEQEDPARGVQPAGNENCGVYEPLAAEDGDTNGSNGNGSAGSKAASATSRVRSHTHSTQPGLRVEVMHLNISSHG